MAIILPSWFSTGNKNNMSMVPVPFTFAFCPKKLTKSIALHVLRTILTDETVEYQLILNFY
jgi:hypothetical protein